MATHRYAHVQAMAEHFAVGYVEVSAKTGEGVKELFETLPTKIRDEIASKAAARADYTTNVVSCNG